MRRPGEAASRAIAVGLLVLTPHRDSQPQKIML